MNYLLSCELYAVVGHRAILLVWMWLSAIVPLYLMQVLETSRAGEVLPKFRLDTTMFIFLQERLTRTVLDSSLCRIAR